MKEEFKMRFNVMEISSIRAFANIRGGFNNGCKDVYFYRLLGTDPAYTEAVREMDRMLGDSSARGGVFYKRLRELPRIGVGEEMAPYIRMYETWVGSGRTTIASASVHNDRFSTVLVSACNKILELYRKLSAGCSESQEQNFMIKILFWLEQTAGQMMAGWDERMAAKVVAENVCKKQEYLFYCFLAFLGFDVLLLQYKCDIDRELDMLGLSGSYRLGEFGDCSVPEAVEAVRTEPAGRLGNGQIRGQKREPAQTMSSPERPHIQLPPRNRAPRAASRSTSAANSTAALHHTAVVQNTAAAGHAAASHDPQGDGTEAQGQRIEKTYEELALLSSSVVMIAIHSQSGDVIGTGSGIMISTDGYILTNNHVASGGAYYSVKIEDDDQVYQTDELIKYNPDLDLAVIRIDRHLTPLYISKGENKLVRGQRVVAIGSPLGLFNSISDGIIAGFRKINNVDMIQFTAPISHGSSGGAVLNMYGEVIGISTAGFDDGQNINLAMGYECIRAFANSFISTK